MLLAIKSMFWILAYHSKHAYIHTFRNAFSLSIEYCSEQSFHRGKWKRERVCAKERKGQGEKSWKITKINRTQKEEVNRSTLIEIHAYTWISYTKRLHNAYLIIQILHRWSGNRGERIWKIAGFQMQI